MNRNFKLVVKGMTEIHTSTGYLLFDVYRQLNVQHVEAEQIAKYMVRSFNNHEMIIKALKTCELILNDQNNYWCHRPETVLKLVTEAIAKLEEDV